MTDHRRDVVALLFAIACLFGLLYYTNFGPIAQRCTASLASPEARS